MGQQVIELLPDSSNKLLRRWQGPGTVVQVKSPYSYLIKLEQGQRRWLHANKLRPYHRRVNEVVINNCAIIYDTCLLYTSPSPRDRQKSRMPSSA